MQLPVTFAVVTKDSSRKMSLRGICSAAFLLNFLYFCWSLSFISGISDRKPFYL
jgi:hypothetical protein